mgnify:CR=1 FL=1
MGCCGSEPKKQNNNNNNQDNDDDDDDIVEKDGLGDTKNLILWGVLIIIIAGFLIWLN